MISIDIHRQRFSKKSWRMSCRFVLSPWRNYRELTVIELLLIILSMLNSIKKRPPSILQIVFLRIVEYIRVYPGLFGDMWKFCKYKLFGC